MKGGDNMTIKQLVEWATEHGYDLESTVFNTEVIPGDRWGEERVRIWSSPDKWDLIYESDFEDD
jgi:hypothetical protein